MKPDRTSPHWITAAFLFVLAIVSGVWMMQTPERFDAGQWFIAGGTLGLFFEVAALVLPSYERERDEENVATSNTAS